MHRQFADPDAATTAEIALPSTTLVLPAPRATPENLPPAPDPRGRPAAPGRTGAAWTPASIATAIAAALLLGFLAQLTVIGHLRHSRDQHQAYDQLRLEFAEGTGPTGQSDQHGRLLAPGTPLAYLQIPGIGLREVILEGTSSAVLRSGAGHRRDTPLPGQAGTAVIMGRAAAYGGPFSRLHELQVGETFTVTTGQGPSTFKVLAVRRAGDPMPAAPAPGAGRLSLVTATGSAFAPSGALWVDADLVTAVHPAAARPLNAAGLSPAEAVMAGDHSAWFPLVLLIQALLGAACATAWARVRLGRRAAWVIGLPVLAALGVAVAQQFTLLLPNLT